MAMIPHGGGNSYDVAVARPSGEAVAYACARLCEELIDTEYDHPNFTRYRTGDECAAEIRKRFGLTKECKDGESD